PDRRARARADEADGVPRQRRAGADRRRERALSGAGAEDDRRRRPRRLVSLSDGHRPDVSVAPAVPRAAKRADDAARVRMDRRYVARARPCHRGEHRARCPRRAARQSDRVVALTTGGRRPVLTLAWVKPTAARTPGPQARLGDPPPDARGYARGLAFVDHRRAARRDEAP